MSCLVEMKCLVAIFSEAHDRNVLASKIVRCHEVKYKATKKNQWFEIAA